MTTSSIERRERQRERARRNRKRDARRHGPVGWTELLTSLGTAAIVGLLVRRAGPDRETLVAFVSVALAIVCAIAARFEERRRGRMSPVWAILAGLALGFVAATGFLMGEGSWSILFVLVGGLTLVAIVIGRPPDRDPARRDRARLASDDPQFR